MSSIWYAYFVRCNDNSLYAGITTDLERRTKEHNSQSGKGAKYTRARQPVELVYFEIMESRSIASKREYNLKKLSKNHKEKLVVNFTSIEN